MSPAGAMRGARLLMTADAAGGIWAYALDLSAGLAARGVEVVLALLGPVPSHLPSIPGVELRPTGLPLDWLADDPAAVLAAAESLAALAREVRPDLIHLNSPPHAAGAAFPAPVLAVSHSCTATWWDAVRGGPLPPDFAWRADLARRGLLAADAMATPSRAFAEATARRYALPRFPFAIHNGRHPVGPGPAPEAPPAFALTAGRLWDGAKNMETLDRAAARLDLPVLAAGPLSGPNGARVAPRHLRTLGPLAAPELAAWMHRAPIYVSLALYEPFGLAVLEAAQAGCPLVLSDIPTFRELWDGAAIFVPARDDAAAAGAIASLAADPEAHARLGAAALARAARYGVDAMTEATLALHATLLRSGVAAA